MVLNHMDAAFNLGSLEHLLLHCLKVSFLLALICVCEQLCFQVLQPKHE